MSYEPQSFQNPENENDNDKNGEYVIYQNPDHRNKHTKSEKNMLKNLKNYLSCLMNIE